jgi:hypothetical protein
MARWGNRRNMRNTSRGILTAPCATMCLALLLMACAGTSSSPSRTRAVTPAEACADLARQCGSAADAGALTVNPGAQLTLQEAIDQLSAALLRNAPGTSWKPEAARAKEIQRLRPELALLVEDAAWVTFLATALDGPMENADKARLRRLHERYAAWAPHAEIAAQVESLLADTRDEDLRRALKQLANRSWERERRRPGKIEPPSPPAAGIAPVATPALVDSSDAVSPERFCADRRVEAAEAFAAARGTPDAARKERYLKQSVESLDACIQRYPDSPAAEKARQNRARVEQERAK